MTPPQDCRGDEIEFGARPKVPQRSYVGFYVTVISLAFLMGGAGAAWVMRDKWLPGDEDAQIPLIRAQNGPIKVRPSEPGGMNVPNQDKLIYNRMAGGALPPEVERLLPQPEAPMAPPRPVLPLPGSASAPVAPPPPAVPARPVTSAPLPPPTEPAREVARVPDAAESLPMPPPPPAPPSVAAPTPTPPAPQMEAVTPPLAPVATPRAQPAAPLPTTGATGGYRIQLVSVRSEDTAKQEWTRLRQRNVDLLGKLDQSVSRADLGGDRGIYYRLRAGPLADEDAAKKLCAELAKRNVGCLVVRPGS